MTWGPKGRIAVVTGASSGIGEAVARRLARAGMTVVAVARREDRLQALSADQPGIVPHVADVTRMEDLDALAARVRAGFGACHALVNNAGVRGGPLRDRGDLDEALRVVDVNLIGAMRCTAAFAALLRDSAPSRVVNVASVAGKLGAGPAGYAASKFGLVGFTESLSFSWAADGVTVSQLNPGFIETEGFPQAKLRGGPLGRAVGEPEDVARALHRVLVTGRREVTVPAWYRAAVVTRHVANPLYRRLMGRALRRRD